MPLPRFVRSRPFLAGLLATATLLAGCETAYYSAMEKVGFAKRDILVSRVESARDSQQEARQATVRYVERFALGLGGSACQQAGTDDRAHRWLSLPCAQSSALISATAVKRTRAPRGLRKFEETVS